MGSTLSTSGSACLCALALLALAGCQDLGPGTVPYTPNASQGGGEAVVQRALGGRIATPWASSGPSAP